VPAAALSGRQAMQLVCKRDGRRFVAESPVAQSGAVEGGRESRIKDSVGAEVAGSDRSQADGKRDDESAGGVV
jgi:hypothetical protein